MQCSKTHNGKQRAIEKRKKNNLEEQKEILDNKKFSKNLKKYLKSNQILENKKNYQEYYFQTYIFQIKLNVQINMNINDLETE